MAENTIFNKLFGAPDFEARQQRAMLDKLPQYGDTQPRSAFYPAPPQGPQDIFAPTQFGGAQPAAPAPQPAPIVHPLLGAQSASPPLTPSAMPQIGRNPPATPRAGQMGPFAGMEGFQSPGGGLAFMDPVSPDGRSASDIQAAITGEGTGPQGYTDADREFLRSEMQAGKVEQAKRGIGERIAAKELIKSLESQGMSPQDIKDKIGATADMTPAQALSGLKKLQKTKELAGGDSPDYAKIRDSSITGEKWDTDEQGNKTPKNEQAQGSLYIDRGDDFGPDPQSEERLKDYMTPGQERQFERGTRSLSRGNKLGRDERRRLDAMLEKVEKKRDREYIKKQADAEAETIRDARKKAKSAEEKQWLDAQAKELGLLHSREKNYLSASSNAKKEMMTPEQFLALQEQIGAVGATITDFNKRGKAPAQPAQAQTGAPKEYATIEDAEAAGLPPGTQITVGGRTAIIR